ncbi:MAG: HIT family protein [Candidatus Paceibacterota bacterium]
MECKYDANAKKDPNYISETKYWNIFLASSQGYLGRCVVALKRHCGEMAGLKKEEWLDFAGLAKKLENTMKKSFNATMFNWTCLMNEAYKEKNPEPHIHWHFRPRYNHKVNFEGTIFEDSEFGRHYDRTKEMKISDKVRKAIIEKIREHL